MHACQVESARPFTMHVAPGGQRQRSKLDRGLDRQRHLAVKYGAVQRAPLSDHAWNPYSDVAKTTWHRCSSLETRTSHRTRTSSACGCSLLQVMSTLASSMMMTGHCAVPSSWPLSRTSAQASSAELHREPHSVSMHCCTAIFDSSGHAVLCEQVPAPT